MSRGVHIEHHYSPVPSPASLQRRLRKGLYVLTALGLEARCSRCGDTWPADTEFFHAAPNTTTGLCCMCKACHAEWRGARRHAQRHPQAEAA